MASGNQKEIYSHIRYIVPDPFGGQSYELTRIFYPLPIAGSRTGQEAELSDKRIIITGDAGSGKTTLAKRLFIYFLNLKENGTSDQALREKYKLPEGLNPVFLSLRSVEDYDTCFDELIASETKDCASSVLIADGLDEVADAQLKKFIKAFERLLESLPKLSLIITSRPTAVNKSILKELIWKNGFTELSLEPFSLAQIIEYGSKRLELVCDAEGLEGLKKSFLDIVSGSKRTLSPDILKKPLELEILLSHILTDTDVTFAERTELIEQMLNGLLAGREAAVDREAFFKDQMTFLSILAFETMKRDTLYIDDEALRQAQLTALRFSFNMSSVISSWSQKPFEMLKNLSANTGIFEEDKQGQGELRFAFAIRTYQEYLCAWACCRLRMSAEADAPDPFYFIRERTGDSMWTGALSFILSFMEQGNHKDFDSAVKYAFEHIDTEAGVKNIIDSGISINYERARVLCRRFFRMSTTWDSELLTACLASQYSDVWMEALRDLYLEEAALYKTKGNCLDVVKPYILAYTLAMLLTKSDMLKPEELLLSEHFSDNMLGAQAISVFVNIYLDEMLPEFKEYASDILLHLSENVIGRLELLARESRDFIYIKALSDILVADISLSRHAERALGSEAVSSVSDMIEASQDIFLSAWELSFEDEQDLLKGDMTATLVSTLGALPVSRKLADERINNVFCISFIRGQFMYLRRLWQIEGIGAALAMIYCYRERSNFLDIWETMVKELVDEGDCTRRGENIYRQQSERLKELGWTREVPVNVF